MHHPCLMHSFFKNLFIYLFILVGGSLLYNIVVGFSIHWHESAMGVYVFPASHFPPHPIPQGHPSAPALSTLSHRSNLDWQSVSHMIIYMFQCYPLKSSHPRLLPQNPKDCSLHLCLFAFIFIYLHIFWILPLRVSFMKAEALSVAVSSTLNT